MLERYGLVPTRAKSVRVGDVFGRLTVIAFGQVDGTYIYKAVCQCLCGSEAKAVRFDGLVNGSVISCGCVQKERTSTHKQSKSRHYGRWRNIMDRCYNPECDAFPNYGGRGIAVCLEWHTIEGFIKGLPDGFFAGAEIDRINNDGDYEPGNVRWATRRENALNRRSNRRVEYNGRTQSLIEWANETGITVGTIWTRLDDGWSAERALTTPTMSAHERMAKAHETRWAGHTKNPSPEPRVIATYLYRGQMLTLNEISLATGIPSKLLRKRICERGWTVERATERVA